MTDIETQGCEAAAQHSDPQTGPAAELDLFAVEDVFALGEIYPSDSGGAHE